MATHPTRSQQKARDLVAQALLMITEASRLDGRGMFDAKTIDDVAPRIARAGSAFGLNEIVAKSLELRCLNLGIAGSTAELLTLMETKMPALHMLLASDDDFRTMVAQLEDELGSL